MKPIILITSYFVDRNEIKGAPHRGKKNQDLAICTFDYINAVEKAGGVPIVAPAIGDDEAVSRMFEIADGILFSGGEDVNPTHYNEGITAGNLVISEKRDYFELKLSRLILESNKPVLGICRGMQLMNIAAGGTLHQDLKTKVRHNKPNTPKDKKLHSIELVENTRLHNIYKTRVKEVNSFHHQGIKNIADIFVPTAFAEDGIIEAYEMKGDRFILGVQWHPEMLHERYPEEFEIFKAFIRSII